MRPANRTFLLFCALLAFVVGCLWLMTSISPVAAACRTEPVTESTPTGIAECEVYGEGIASMWGGPGVARNDCVYPWDACTPIRITVIATGAWIEVRPTMFCDCYTGTANQRIVDLSPDVVAALNLDPAAGLWRVRVEPAGGVTLPNTAMPAP